MKGSPAVKGDLPELCTGRKIVLQPVQHSYGGSSGQEIGIHRHKVGIAPIEGIIASKIRGRYVAQRRDIKLEAHAAAATRSNSFSILLKFVNL
jgi:hypothetical protein